MKKTILHIEGMHCVSCEMILEKELKKIPGLKECKVYHKKGNAEIMCDKNIPTSAFAKTVSDCGYKLVEEGEKERAGTSKETQRGGLLPDYLQIFLIMLVLGSLFFLASKSNITSLLPDFRGDVSVIIALFLGVVASLSTCLALTGGIVMSFGSLVHIHEGRKKHFLSRATPHIYFHIGRIGGFAVLGGLLGLIGSKINYSLTFTGYLTIFIAVVMFYIGLQILNIVPNITKLGFHLPKFLSSKIHDLEKKDHHLMPVAIGVFTFFLPCGFTQSMQLAAVNSQSFLGGALIMGAFAIGTMPVLLSIGIGSTYAHKEKMRFFYHLIGVIVIFFSLYSLNSGLILAGSRTTIDFWNKGGESVSAEISEDFQIIKMDVDWSFKPSQFEIKKGVPVRWEINGINVSGCTNEIVIPQFNIRKKIDSGLNVIEFTPEKEGTIPFSCWMGMQNGRFIVTE